jgi:hypothetical protein
VTGKDIVRKKQINIAAVSNGYGTNGHKFASCELSYRVSTIKNPEFGGILKERKWSSFTDVKGLLHTTGIEIPTKFFLATSRVVVREIKLDVLCG